MKKLLFLLMYILIFMSAVCYAEQKSIDVSLKYVSGTQFDTNDEGVTDVEGVVDFSVKDSIFEGYFDESKLCTVWDVIDTDSGLSKASCYGSDACCKMVEIENVVSSWDNDFYVYSNSKEGSNFRVSARIIYVDFSLDQSNPYADILYSDSDYLYAVFVGKETFTRSIGELELLNGSVDVDFAVLSPENNSVLLSGESIWFEANCNQSVGLYYILDGQLFTDLGQGEVFGTYLNGSGKFGVLQNGGHELLLHLFGPGIDEQNLTLGFSVNDTAAPKVNVTVNGLDLNGTIIEGNDLLGNFEISCNESCLINYLVNNDTSGNIDINKGAVSNLFASLVSGRNTLFLNISDINNNIDYLTYGFNYSVPASCNDGEENGNEEGIDCGGDCSDCINFNVSLDKYTYTVGESVYLTIISRKDSVVNYTLLINGNFLYSDSVGSYSPNFPIFVTRKLSSVTQAGNYQILATMSYLNLTEFGSVMFEIKPDNTNPLTLSASINRSSIAKGEEIYASASSNKDGDSVSYIWDFGDGHTLNSRTGVHKYASNGSFRVNITAYYLDWSKSLVMDVEVYNKYNLSFKVVNNSGGDLEEAFIEIGGSQYETSAIGEFSQMVREGEYNIEVSKNGYTTFENTSYVNKDIHFKVTLNNTRTDESAPKITILAPANGQVSTSFDIEISFKVEDESSVDCNLYFLQDGDIWSSSAQISDIENAESNSFFIQDLELGEYQWKVSCIDTFGNFAQTDNQSFEISESQVVAEPEQDLEKIVSDYSNIITSLGNLPLKEQEAMEALGLIDELARSKKELERAKRDLYNIKWRKLNETEKGAEKNRILERIGNILNNTPLKLQVIDSQDFVVYPTEEEIKGAVKLILDSEGKDIDEKLIKEYTNYMLGLQDKLSVTTHVKVVELEMYSGGKKELTLVQKDFNLKDLEGGQSMVEYIPKEIAASADQIKSPFKFEVIVDDPILDFTLANQSFGYYIERQMDIEKIKSIKTLIVQMKMPKKSSIVGFAVFDNLSEVIIDQGTMRLIVEIGLILILLAIYFLPKRTYGRAFLFIKHRSSWKELGKIKAEVKVGLRKIDDNKYDEAKEVYSNIKIRFGNLPKDLKKDAILSVNLLSDKLNISYINKLLSEAFEAINKDKKQARGAYKKITGLYKYVGKEHKKEVIERCKKLHEELNAKSKS